ncbi:MAG TPA: MarR family transcriptional regulator [Candidatus Acidoferrales bacterium]|nr:MarR family transcriptional regulator [Candidatus Acidoferrales bacterium]
MATKGSVDYKVLANFRYEIRRYLTYSEQAARAAGIEPHQHQALLAIKGLPRNLKATVGVLAERLQIQHHSAVELSDRLEANGFIQRVRSQADRREVILRLTGKAERIVRELSMPYRLELHEAGQRLLQALEAALAQPRNNHASRDAVRPAKENHRRRRKAPAEH